VPSRRGLARTLTWRRTLFLVTAAAALLMSPLALALGSSAPAAASGDWSYAVVTVVAPLATPPLTAAGDALAEPSGASRATKQTMPDLVDQPGWGELTMIGPRAEGIGARLGPGEAALVPLERSYGAPLGSGVGPPLIATVLPPPADGASGSSVVIVRPTRTVVASRSGGGGGVSVPYSGGDGWSYAVASWYGPGFYGNRTACGLTYTESSWGVAHRSLPCGTPVQFRHNGRVVTAPVIDRGPYVSGRTWDLSAAVCRALGHCYTAGIYWRFP
jgi:hypothetical protein